MLSGGLQIDVCDLSSVAAAVAAVVEACGGNRNPPPLHGLINNAGVAPPLVASDILATNLYGVKVSQTQGIVSNPSIPPQTLYLPRRSL